MHIYESISVGSLHHQVAVLVPFCFRFGKIFFFKTNKASLIRDQYYHLADDGSPSPQFIQQRKYGEHLRSWTNTIGSRSLPIKVTQTFNSGPEKLSTPFKNYLRPGCEPRFFFVFIFFLSHLRLGRLRYCVFTLLTLHGWKLKKRQKEGGLSFRDSEEESEALEAANSFSRIDQRMDKKLENKDEEKNPKLKKLCSLETLFHHHRKISKLKLFESCKFLIYILFCDNLYS